MSFQSLSRRHFLQAGAASLILTRPARGESRYALEIVEGKVGPTRATLVDGLLPGPTLRWREGDLAEIAVTNRLREQTSIHWHGIRTPSEMDGVPGLSFAGIAPGETFTYRFPLRQSGTYWYHGHSGFQEQIGLAGAIVIEPSRGYAQPFEREHVLMLSDWTDEDPAQILSNLKFQSDYYNYGQRTLFGGGSLKERLDWGRMRMSPTDILDVSGAAYRYLINGKSDWSGLFAAGERVRLRLINAAAMNIFDFRIPGLKLTVVAADGNEVAPVEVDQIRIATAETYDVIVTPDASRAYCLFAEVEDRSGFVAGTLAPKFGMSAAPPPMDPRPLRSMADMGMMEGMEMDHSPALDAPREGVEVDNVAMMPMARQEQADFDAPEGRRVLTYADLKATKPGSDQREPSREVVLHLTGNMQRYIWGFDGKRYSDAKPIHLSLGERVRFVLINDTMMEHPVHLHGLWSEIENGQDAFRPYKHTVNIKPGEKLSFLVSADVPGRWAFHCHIMMHMESGMFREVHVA
ncbi:MAG TPA: multicopper oxidase domain-containing protein [Magnetospirillaceae bacterium]|nr:multicopper oxidase domain-containing protein [Magnetospirillaceae bacterium]